MVSKVSAGASARSRSSHPPADYNSKQQAGLPLFQCMGCLWCMPACVCIRRCKLSNSHAEQKYHVKIMGVSYGRCKKYWNDFEALYDSLELRYSTELEAVPFPTYVVRSRNNTKKESVESNRKNLENLMATLLKHPSLSRSEAVTEFLQLTEFVHEELQTDSASGAAEALRNRPGPTPDTVRPVYHSTALDEGDEADDEETAPALDERAPTGEGRGVKGGMVTSKTSPGGGNGRPVISESSSTVWIGR